MSSISRTVSPLTAVACVIIGLWGVGCQQIPVDSSPGPSASPTSSPNATAPPQSNRTTTEVEPNDSFANATAVTSPDGENGEGVTLSGRIGEAYDVDTYDLGAFSEGDLLLVQVTRESARLEPSVALYSGEQNLINEDTLASVLSASADPMVQHVVREDTDHLYVAVSHNYVAETIGGYSVTLHVDRQGGTASPEPQVVYLNFAGGTVDNPYAGQITTGAFEGADVDSSYADDTEEIKAAIIETFKQNYKRFNVVVLDSDNFARPVSDDYAEMFFGGFNSYAFGVAESVDIYNTDKNDLAITFVESFSPDMFPRRPSAQALGVAIGNVAAHEMGHLLGLHHVRDATALMDESSPAFTLLFDQEFKRASLSPLVFPLGNQNAADLLEVIVGLSTDTNAAVASAMLRTAVSLEAVEMKELAGDDAVDVPHCLNCAMRRLTSFGPFVDPSKAF